MIWTSANTFASGVIYLLRIAIYLQMGNLCVFSELVITAVVWQWTKIVAGSLSYSSCWE
jgi:hypothetical protein